ncbi:hypothetical protein BDF14DRAFT_1876193 [Spinellus fusiger]|nr:hypothetical protein BDF14DRAFT_1876193 [Spinellus fusiger]
MCCNSELRYPQVVWRFRCPVCDTVNDLKARISSPSTSTSTPTSVANTPYTPCTPCSPATLKQLRRLVAQVKQREKIKLKSGVGIEEKERECIYEPIEKWVDRLFGHWISLNQSFISPVNVIRAMMTATDRLLKRPCVPLQHPSDIRFLLIILENPLLTQHNFPAETKYHHSLLKRIFGLLSCLNNTCHQALVYWFADFPSSRLSVLVDLVQTFLSHRITRARKSQQSMPAAYESDWKIASAARVMALLYYVHLMGDYGSWQARSGKFAFCQYPFLISMGSKMQIMEADAKQQMETKWREAFFNMIFHQKTAMPYLMLRVRREHLIEDSLSQLSQNELDLKKSLRIEFIGEEGVDAGGLRKEWFLLLVRSLFDPQYGMFTFDEDSNLYWFNPASFENEDQFFLVGVVLGLAIYNSTILDIHLPTACYKKLLHQPVTMADLGVFRPSLTHGFQQLLAFEGDVENVFCRSFVAEIEAFGQRRCVPLMDGGTNCMVTDKNRQQFVDLYVEYVLNTSVERQFGAFQRGFYHVCGGNALSLFRPEEIELLVRGSDEPLEIEELRRQTEYHGFDENETTIVDFWSIMKEMEPQQQRRLLMFFTGSDRIPATGTSNMQLQITWGGDVLDRLPSAHTCFNQLVLYRYESREKLKRMLEMAMMESQGFYVQ